MKVVDYSFLQGSKQCQQRHSTKLQGLSLLRAETTLSGAVYARLVEILPPYTIEFDHNILDVKINNQVSLAVQNSAGLINSPELQFASYEGSAIHVDPVNGFSGVNYPVGTRRRPVDNLADALGIQTKRKPPL